MAKRKKGKRKAKIGINGLPMSKKEERRVREVEALALRHPNSPVIAP